MNNTNLLRTVLFTAATAAVLFNIWYFCPRSADSGAPVAVDVPGLPKHQFPPRVIPKTGWRPFDAGKTVKGHPEKTVEQMQAFYRYRFIYKKKHGTFPESDFELYFDSKKDLASYGFKSEAERLARFRNEDVGLSDEYHDFPNWDKYSPYAYPKKRPDGSSIGSSKQPGTRDVLAYTNIYYHKNATLMPDRSWDGDPIGFYLVMWEDGSITKVPWEKVRYTYPQVAGAPDACFPGQAGVPTVTYTEVERNQRILPLKPDGSNPNMVAKK